MSKSKSKFFNIRKEKEETKADYVDNSVDELLNTIQETAKEIASLSQQPLTIEEVKVVEEKANENKKAYNVFYDANNKNYMLETIEYEGDRIINKEVKSLGLNQHMTMFHIKKIFTDKIILRKKGV